MDDGNPSSFSPRELYEVTQDDAPEVHKQQQLHMLIRNEAEKSLKVYKRFSVGFAVFVCLLLAVVVAISIVLASNVHSCNDFTDAQKQLINQVIHPAYLPNFWSSITDNAVSPPPRLAHADAAVAEVAVYIFGGTYGSDPLHIPYVTYGDLWKYTAVNDSWSNITQLGDIPAPRLHASLVAKDDDTLLLFGGFNVFQTVLGHHSYSSFYEYAITANRWTRLDTAIVGPQPSARGAQAATWVNGAMYMFGGFPIIAATGHLKELWKFTWSTQTWLNISLSTPSPEGRIGFAFIALSAQTALITAGGCSITVNPYGQCDTVWLYNIPNNTWVALSDNDTPFARRASSAGAAVGGVVYQFGGVWLNGTTSFRMFNDLNAFDAELSLWMPIYPNYGRGSTPPPTFGQSLTRVGRQLVLFGGRTSSPAQPGSAQTWEYTSIVPTA